jgi:hypothetical protein
MAISHGPGERAPAGSRPSRSLVKRRHKKGQTAEREQKQRRKLGDGRRARSQGRSPNRVSQRIRRARLILQTLMESKVARILEAEKEAGELGFEPRLTDPESVVLPLHYSPRGL